MKGKEVIGRALIAAGITTGGVALDACAPQPPQAQAQVREFQPVSAQQQPPSTPEARIVFPAIGRAFTQTVESAPAAVPSATPPEPPKSTATPEPTVTPKPEPAATAEPKVAEIQCNILDPKLCATGEYIQWTNPEGKTAQMIGFNLEKGTKIKTPEKLQVAKAKVNKPSPIDGYIAMGKNADNTITFQFIGDLQFNNTRTENMEPGAVIATIDDTSVKVFGRYNFVFYVSNERILNMMFPKITSKEPKVITHNGPNKPATTSVRFFDVPLQK